jgi:hypothetical protein
MAGPIIVEGPDGQEYEFPAGTSPDVMKQAMRKRYAATTALAAPAQPAGPFLQRAAGMLPAGTQPVFPAGAPATGKQAALDARNERITAAQRVQRTVREQTATERDLRVKPVEEAAGRAGKLAKDAASDDIMANPGSYALGGGFRFNLGRQAEQEVYDEAGVVPVDTAYAQRGVNSTLWGVPGIVSKEARARLAQAGEDQPGAALAGDLTGIVAGGAATWVPARAGVNALVRPLIPQGADAASRGVRYISPLAGQTGGVMLQNAGTQAGVFEPIRAETAGEDLTLGGMAAAAKRGLEDPLNLLPLGLSAVNRTWNQLTSGIATPSARAADMANRYGVGPRQTAASQGITQTTQALGGQLQGADIRGLTNIENALRFALRDNQNIPDVNARIATGFQRIRESLPLEDDPTLNLARLIEREFAPDAPQTRDIIRRFLLKVGMDSPGGGQIVGDAANQMRGQQADVLRTELESSFGAQPKTEAQAALQESLDQFSAAYNNVMPQAPRTGPQADEALDFLVGSQTNQLPPQTNLQALLYERARAAGMTVDNFILQNPLEALHWVQSDLADQARSLRAANTPDANLERVVQNMQRPLRDALPEYGQLQNLWRQYSQALGRLGYTRGAEAGVKAELSTVPGFGDKIFGPGGISKSEQGTQTAADLFLQMDDLSQRSAGLSVRDVINDELRKAKAAGLEERYQTAANMRKVATEGGLDALRRVFGEAGDRVARRIEQFMDANEFARNIDPEFNSATMNKAQSMATGAQPFAGSMGQATQSAAGSLGQNAFGDAVLLASGITNAPLLTAMRGMPWLADRLQPGARTQRNIAETLLRRGEIGSQVPPRPGGPAPITPIDPAMVPGARPPPGGPPPGGAPPAGGTPPQAPAPRTVGVAPAVAGAPMGAPAPTTPTRTSGLIGNGDLTNAAFGAGLGGIAPAESPEERARNMAIGAGIGIAGGSRTVGKVLGVKGDDVARPQGFVGRASRDPAIQRRLDTAERMEKEGASREEIWTETMVMRGADGKLRAEIDDKPSRISNAVFDRIKESGQYDGRAAWALEHPELYKSYPELGEGRMVMTASETPRGSVERLIVNGKEVDSTTYVSGPGTNAQRSVALHELQHGVQNIEGFARGGTVGQFTDILTRLGAGPKDAEDGLILAVHLERQNGSFEEALGAFELTMGRTPTSKAQRLAKDYGRESLSTMTELGSMAAYRRLAGEVEARLVQTRRNMSMEDRRKRPAWEDEDVARDQQTVNFDNTRAEMAGAGGYFGRQSMRPPGSGPSAREIETQQQWATATPIVTQARTTAQSAQQAADAALQSKAPADIARAKDAKKTLVSQIKEAQASRAGMDTPEDARLAETLASLTENTSDPVLLSTQISAAKTSLDRLLTDIGSPSEGNLIPVRTNILTRTQAPRSAAEGPQDRASVTRYAEGEAPPVKGMGFGAETPKRKYPLAPKSEWYGNANFEQTGGKIQQMTPDEFLAQVRPLEVDDVARDNIDDLKRHMQSGKTLDPLSIDAKGKEDGRHRAIAAKELGIESVPVLRWDSGEAPPIKSMGFGASTPKTPQQAVRFETPGSPEYEAAVAKGLDMSQAGRMARAKEMGFNEEGFVPQWEAKDYGLGGEWTRKNKQRVFKTAREAEGQIVRTQKAVNEIFGFNPQASDGRLIAARKAMYETPEYKSGNLEEWKKTPEYEAYKQIEKLVDRQAARGNALARTELIAARLGQRLNIPGGRIVGVDEIFGPIKRGKLSPDVTSYGETTVMLPVTRFIDDALQGKNLEKTVRKYIVDEFGEDALLENPREVETYIKSLLNAAEWVRNRKLSDEVESYARWYAGEGTDRAMPGIAAADPTPAEIVPPSIMRVLVKRDKDGNIENMRSVNAAFDPEKSGSSTLLAAAPFAAVGGAGLTLAGEDARNQRTVGKPKTSQSARTVGKAKTN